MASLSPLLTAIHFLARPGSVRRMLLLGAGPSLPVAQHNLSQGAFSLRGFDPALWPIMADVTQLNQVLMNLCINARDAMPQGGRIEIVADNVRFDATSPQLGSGAEPGPYVHLAVSDTGSGIPQEIIDKISDPFFTTKVAGKGTGLGLSTVVGIIKSHGGFMSVDSAVGRGTIFNLFLPALAEARVAAALKPIAVPAAARRETILLVEDDDAVRETLSLLLEHAGYRIVVVPDGVKALAAFDRERGVIFLVITDMMLPGMNGEEIIAALRERDPTLRIIAMSGVMDEEALRKLPVPGPAVLPLSKPLTSQVLLAAIRSQSGA